LLLMRSSDFDPQCFGKPMFTGTEISLFLPQHCQEPSVGHLSRGSANNVLPQELQYMMLVPCISMKWPDKKYINEDVNTSNAKPMLPSPCVQEVLPLESEWKQEMTHAHRWGDSNYGGSYGCMPYLTQDSLGDRTSTTHLAVDCHENVNVESRTRPYAHDTQALHMHVRAEKPLTTETKWGKTTSTKKTSNAWGQLTCHQNRNGTFYYTRILRTNLFLSSPRTLAKLSPHRPLIG